MAKIDVSEFQKTKPVVQMAPLIDIVFLTLIFFMTLSIFGQMESELNISVPKAKEAKDTVRGAGEIIINVTKEGKVIVNQRVLSHAELTDMLRRVSTLFPNQPVIIRADEKTFHKFVVSVLDACAGANIWNIAFSTTKEEDR
jgi:biopolymer transport protein ExbD